jgi:ornithine carbamoyltransferase
MVTDLISLADLQTDEVEAILQLAAELKQHPKSGPKPLFGRTVVLIFEKPSLRTRLTFEVGVFQLGGQSIFIEDKLGVRESVPDVARNLERWVDGIVARTFRHDDVVELAQHAHVPVINALTDKLHPCQVLADAQTAREHLGTLDEKRVAFVGDGNNMCASWAHLACHYPIHLTLVCPEGYELEDDVRQYVQLHAKGSFRICHDPALGVKDADVVYTDVWASMGQEDEHTLRTKAFAKFQVNAALMAKAKPGAVFMHCLPAHRGEEVTDDVIESKQSVVFDQAENRLHAQKAVMSLLMGNGE